MTEHEAKQELEDRLHLIEAMLQQGRRTTQYWGWTFLLWGSAYLVAMAWASISGRPAVAWGVTMIAASGLTALIAKQKAKGQPFTVTGRSVMILWITIGGALFLFCFSTVLTGHLEPHSFIAAIETFVGTAHLASGWLLRWRIQILNGALWWAAALTSCLVRDQQVSCIFIAITVIGFVAFGIYLMILEARACSRTKMVAHA